MQIGRDSNGTKCNKKEITNRKEKMKKTRLKMNREKLSEWKRIKKKGGDKRPLD